MNQNGQTHGPERRKFNRKKFAAGIDYSIVSIPQGEGMMKDLSDQGLGLF